MSATREPNYQDWPGLFGPHPQSHPGSQFIRSPARNLTPAPDSQPPPNVTEWVVTSVTRRPPRQTTTMILPS
ncbi:hypothetical protein BDP81DRAFT_414154 [Colletotrichum phormii]|uniref:Uncharacterized protein n=1 Tax=Colletotrichum phormii TaxID=359342 RepID=A0AAJ0A557_9PEZI|nr:uncharacterized protein BDP81DRAFT_414154 [Colletotrichum phormii]KAK1656093.1 hypothetical protein BDP81DRAFT_414154 [Colletotrichum phormii]